MNFVRYFIKKNVLCALSIICFIFLFVGGPDYHSILSFKLGWDLGHIISFTIWSYLLLTTWKGMGEKPFYTQFVYILTITLVVGGLIEILQEKIGRTISIYDIYNDLIGSLITLCFFVPSRKKILKIRLKIIQGTVIVITFWAMFPFVSTLIDEAIANTLFPVLADFETPFEARRWSSKSELRRVKNIGENRGFVLEVPLTTERFSGVKLKHFPGDWRNYSALEFSVYNPSNNTLVINCKIFDVFHIKNGGKYSDRFNKRVKVSHGWNTIRILMNNIEDSPRSRKTDMSNIKGFQIFVSKLPEPGILYIDNVKLVEH